MRLTSAALVLVLLLCLRYSAASARAAPTVAGVRLGMTSNAAIATLKSEGVAVTHTFFKQCLRDELARAAGRASPTGPGRCVQSVDARYAGGDLSIWFVEDLPKKPGSSVVTTIAVNAATDLAAFASILKRAGRPSLTDGKTPWFVAMWCFDFVCTDMNESLANPSSGPMLFVNRHDAPGLTLEDARIGTSRVPDFRRPLASDPGVNYGPTPRQAVQHILLTFKGAPLVFERVNVVGRYAMVLSNGEVMPGAADHAPILLEHFAFGWQPLMPGPLRCELEGRSISTRDQQLLVHGMPKPAGDRPCTALRTGDAGRRRALKPCAGCATRNLCRRPWSRAISRSSIGRTAPMEVKPCTASAMAAGISSQAVAARSMPMILARSPYHDPPNAALAPPVPPVLVSATACIALCG